MMSDQNIIQVCNIGKVFKVYFDKGSTLKEKVIFANRNKYENREILTDISFVIPKGQAVGFIGKNGCGKSTILKLLSRILKPNKGSISINGRVSSLIELGAGFHPDMSGRENIYINASIFGLKKEEIDEKIDDIIEFSELGEFIDNPVRTYSSGMYMRLAFSVAINVNADVLLIDEILAVGDVSFQKKCFQKLNDIKREGVTIAIVSHSMEQLYNICDRLLWVENGVIREDGEPRLVGMHYLDSMEDERVEHLANQSRESFKDERRHSILDLTKNVHPDARRDGTQEVYFTKVILENESGEECHYFNTGDQAVLKIRYKTNHDGIKVNFNMDFVSDNWQYCYGSCFAKPGDDLPILKSEGEVQFRIDKLMLLPGKYYLDIGINGEHGELYDNVRNIIQIKIRDYVSDEFGPCTFSHKWSIND
ncbi:MAG: ABC transporter ATP-binding protein [Lachnospiraceae bacterium]|nr:ABC transporter ATP-binding protein [Lachnospiraceae bacterium]